MLAAAVQHNSVPPLHLDTWVPCSLLCGVSSTQIQLPNTRAALQEVRLIRSAVAVHRAGWACRCNTVTACSPCRGLAHLSVCVVRGLYMEGETSVLAWPRLNVTWLVALGFIFCTYVPSSKHSGGPEVRIRGFSCNFPASSSSSPWSLC